MPASLKELFSNQLIKSLLPALLLLLSAAPSFASDAEHNEAFDPAAAIKHHISDAHKWEFFEGANIYLPVILYSSDRGLEVFSSKPFYQGHGHETAEYNGYRLEHEHIVPTEAGRKVYDFSITKNVASLFLSVALLLGIFFTIAGRYKSNRGKAPRGIQSFFEPIIVFIRDEIAKPNIGPKYERFLPYLLTIFFFIWFNNMLGLFPAGANLTGNIAVTMVLAICTFFITVFNGNKSYWAHIFKTPGVPVALLPIMIPIEVIGIFTKPFSLMIRLFANITAGHIILLSLFSLIFIFKSLAIGPLSVAFATFMSFLELFVALLQAYVFTLLSALYFGAAVEEHHHEHTADHGIH